MSGGFQQVGDGRAVGGAAAVSHMQWVRSDWPKRIPR